MPSRLSSLLVRDGLVGVKRMEKAFQRQVIYGGSLDTILLEMNLVPEERLTQYLALASGLPPAARDEGSVIEADALGLIVKELAEQYRAVPLAIEGEAVRILVCAPLEITELEDLADLLDRPLQPLITPEYRWHLIYASAYGVDPPARFTTLARSLDVDPTTAPVGRARTVIVEDTTAAEFTSEEPTTPLPQSSVLLADTMKIQSLVEPPQLESDELVAPPAPDDARRKHSTMLGVKPNRASTAGVIAPARPRRVSLVPHQAVKLPKRGPTAPLATDGRESPLPIVRARELLAIAGDRDAVFLTLLRAARSRARWAGLFTIQGGAAIGRVALAEPGIDIAQVNTALFPLDSDSAFHKVVTTKQAHVGPIMSGDPGIDAMLLRLGGQIPPSALIMPIVLRDRVIAIVIAHKSQADIKLVDVTELLPLATAASDAIGRLIVKHKAAGYRTPTGAAVVEPLADFVDTKKHNVPSAADWAVPAKERPAVVVPVPIVEQGSDISMAVEPPRPIDTLLDDIEKAREGAAEELLTDAVDRASDTLGALMRRFPGRLRVDRFAVSGRSLRAQQYGGLLELVVRLGPIASELLIDKMSAPQRDVRFYATVCASELRPRNAIYALTERLFDQDFGVRATAIEALSGYPVDELGQALGRARRAVHSSDPEVVGAATSAIVALGDVDAIPDLIATLEKGDRAGDHARRALVSLTAQDFGTSERKWRKWHETARKRHRIEWLIDGLSHKEDALRELAINDLRRLTGEYFGYHHDLPRREREASAVRWAAWWREHGHRRFVLREDERLRPTAVLPVRRD